MMELSLAPPHAGSQPVIHPDDAARAVERARVMVDAACDALLSVEHLVPEAGALVLDAERLLPRLRAVLDRIDPPH